MKISSVVNICKRNKHIWIYNMGGETETQLPDGTAETKYSGVQWISNGAASYCMAGTPRIESETEFFTQYDVPESEREKYLFKQQGVPNAFELKPYVEQGAEIMARPTSITISVDDTVLRGISYGRNMFFVRERYLEPFKKSPDDAIEFAVRHMENGQPYLYIREEMCGAACIAPYLARDNATWNTAADELRDFSDEVQREIEQDAEAKENAT